MQQISTFFFKCQLIFEYNNYRTTPHIPNKGNKTSAGAFYEMVSEKVRVEQFGNDLIKKFFDIVEKSSLKNKVVF